MKRKFLAAVMLGLTISVASAGITVLHTETAVQAEVIGTGETLQKNSWYAVPSEDNKTTYFQYGVGDGDTVKPATGLQTIGEKTYLFDENGFLLTGEQNVTNQDGQTNTYYFSTKGNSPEEGLGERITGFADNGKYYGPELKKDQLFILDGAQYYAGEDGTILKNGLKNGKDGIYLFGEDGKRLTGNGFQKVKKGDNTEIYYLENDVVSTGNHTKYQRETDEVGWLKVGNDWYLLDVKDGHLLTGWQKVDGCLYYLTPETGKMETGNQKKQGWCELNGSWYSFTPWGSARTGWYLYDHCTYYLHEDGKMEDTVLNLNGNLYFFRSWGGMCQNMWADYNGARYYAGSNGEAYKKKWLRWNGKWYWFQEDGTMMKNSWLLYDKNYYYLKADGTMCSNEWLDNKYYFRSWGGRYQKAWAKVDGIWYYFLEDGTKHGDGWLFYDNNWYYFDNGGKMVANEWRLYDNNWYFFKPWGGMYHDEWGKWKNCWYYFKPWGGMYHDQWLNIGGYDYYFRSWGGRCQNGTFTIDGKKYTFDANGRKTQQGWVYMDGYRRYRNADGSLSNDVTSMFNPSSKYITVDRIRNVVTIYGYNSATNSYDTPIKSMICSVGNPISRTAAGTYKIGWQVQKKKMVGDNYVCWGAYTSQIYGAVYFHGVASNTEDLNTISRAAFQALGTPQSHGCVRLAACDAKWIYQNVGRGTTVRIGDNLACPMNNPTRYEWKGGSYGPDPTWSPL